MTQKHVTSKAKLTFSTKHKVVPTEKVYNK